MIEITTHIMGLITGMITISLLVIVGIVELIKTLSNEVKTIVDEDILSSIYVIMIITFVICIVSYAIYFLTSMSFI